jgi:hypothetical protein
MSSTCSSGAWRFPYSSSPSCWRSGASIACSHSTATAWFASRANPGLGFIRLVIILSALWFWAILSWQAASDIVGYYTGLYVFLAYATLLWFGLGVGTLGILYSADVIERRNLAAAIVLAGYATGTALAYGGALTGEGPGWFVVVVFFLLAYIELRASLSFVDRLSGRLAHAVRTERDLSAAILLAGVAIAAGCIAGRAAAGDFMGWEHAMKDYLARLAWLPAVPVVGALVGYFTRDMARPLPVRGVASALLVVAAASYAVLS